MIIEMRQITDHMIHVETDNEFITIDTSAQEYADTIVVRCYENIYETTPVSKHYLSTAQLLMLDDMLKNGKDVRALLEFLQL
jgi:hypothetical protein